MIREETAVEEGRDRQENERAARRRREADIRPDPVHRALLFLLKEVMQNNPDASVEAKYHLATLDEEFVDKAKLTELEEDEPAKIDPGTGEPAANPTHPIKQSRRFRRTT